MTKNHSPTTRGRISRTLTGRKKTPEHRQKIAEALQGRTKTEDHKDAIADALLGNNNAGRPIIYLMIEFQSVRQAAKHCGVSEKTVRRRLASDRWESCHYCNEASDD